jgi:hypothetical protein
MLVLDAGSEYDVLPKKTFEDEILIYPKSMKNSKCLLMRILIY